MAKVKINFQQTSPKERREMLQGLRKKLDVQESLQSLIETMHRYEEVYGMSTLEFYARYVAGQMGDSREVMLWAGAFDDYQALLREHFQRAAA
ncbi:MAG TPA: hypothetical protein PLD20_02555 [Blastocatellia bacterium]|nr:hypothetical protein [Blastocatellia bacterium]HMV82665.1 hypothetical protein [Blastocatellia bacterium]HMY76753.1 hypothetical protein [Blastocatellia bacterium]HMZ16818.1 hypothetical protein [Blastocatellia bacterium]HNG32288.1 hypothetical protein [Blastocatellia bacterium]